MEVDDYLALSGVQHYAFCPRQWALIHVEGLWAENVLTVAGAIDHERCHDAGVRERRGNLLTIRGFRVVSHTLGLQGVCDVLELHADSSGVEIQGESGLYRPVPVEYKHGKAKVGQEDRVQLCAQAMALEEMLCCEVETGYLYYASEHRREKVEISRELRAETLSIARQMRRLFQSQTTPPPRKRKGCGRCSLKDECVPVLEFATSVKAYVDGAISQEMS